MRGKHFAFTVVAGFVAVFVLTACEWKGGKRHQFGAPREYWRAEPLKMRVYPSSRLVREGNGAVLEARIELLDEMDDTVKGVGDYHFDLASAEATSGATPATRLYSWDVSVMTIEQQKAFYDSITRTYFFRLKLDSPVKEHNLVLRAVLSTPDGKRIDTESPIAGME